MSKPKTTDPMPPASTFESRRGMWGHVCRRMRAVVYQTANPCPECGEAIMPGHRQDRLTEGEFDRMTWRHP